jgi:hypothetical protein
MMDEQTRTLLKQQQWTIVDKDVSLVTQKALFSAWKQYANGVAITLSIHCEEDQFVLYQDVGHAASGTNRTNCGAFSTTNAAVQQLIQSCYDWDDTWEM